ncbi:MAG: hypothetical protein WBG54_20985 [Acidobacteriaceae bacterium]
MNQFATARDAKEYLIGRILAQADRDGVPLSDVERKMLYFSETGWTLPDMMAVSRDFDQNYEQDQYESKIGQVIQRIQDQPGSNGADNWNEAVCRLREEDHYLLVLIDGASCKPAKQSRWEIARLIAAGIAVVAVFLPFLFFVDSHIDNPVVAKWIGMCAFLVLAVLAALLANRGHRDSA